MVYDKRLPSALTLLLAACQQPVAREPHVNVVHLSAAPQTTATPPKEEPPAFDTAARLREFEALEGEALQAYCRKHSGYSGEEFDNCTLRSIGNNSGLLLTIVTSCGGDSCSASAWLFTAKLPEPFYIADAAGTVEAAADGSFLLVEEMVATETEPKHWPIVTLRVDVPSGEKRPFADCFSPKLSPQGKYVVCRNREADVLRVPIGGGKPQLIADAGVTAEAVEWVPYAYIYPGAVEFPHATELSFEIHYADGAVAQRLAPWLE